MNNIYQINLAIAKHLGFWVYHYDKDYEAHCYYLLVDSEFETVAGDWVYNGELFDRGHRKTLDEALNDIPDWNGSSNLALRLLDESGLYYKLEKIALYKYSATIGKSKYASKVTETEDELAAAICQAYCQYHKIDVTVPVELEVD